MKTTIKIKSIGLAKLNNSEYTNLMQRLATQLDKLDTTINIGGITADSKATFAKNLQYMYDIVAQNAASEFTRTLTELDQERDEMTIYLLQAIRTAARSPIAAERQAGTVLYEETKPYIGIQTLPNMQQTAKVRALIVDLDKPANKAHLLSLRLNTIAQALHTKNEEYAKATDDRAEDKGAKKLPDTKELRATMNEQYEQFTLLLTAAAITQPSSELTTCISNINVAIDEANTAYNQRHAQSAKKTSEAKTN